jgi:serine/threonine protein kinase, bacterial
LVDEPPLGGTTAEWHPSPRFGHYILLQRLGSGGFGEVYEARDTKKKRTVALKLLPASISANPVFRARLFREATTAGQLYEPHVVPIHDYGEIDGQLYIDMRLIRGPDLRAVLDDVGPLDPARAVSIVGQIALALDAAHDDQIVHRDVKPANILLAPEDFACLVDFGLANAATDAKLTTVGNTVGTFAYMAPERLSNEKIDHRVDIYALACVLYECLTGTPPYPSGELTALIAAHLTSPIPRPSQQRPDVPTQFDDVIAHGMAKDPDDRFPRATALAAAARLALTESARHSTTSTHRDIAATVDSNDTAAPSRAGRRRRIALLAIAAVAVLAAATAIPYWISNRHHGPGSSPASTVFASVSATIPVGKHPEGVAVDPTAHAAYTANYSDNTVSVIDTTGHSVIATIPVGRGPLGVAVDPTSHTTLTANNRDDTVSVIDTTKRVVTATVKVGTNPWGVAIDPTTHTAYAANNWDNTVSVIDTTNQTVTATVQVGKHPEGVAVDPTTHTAYITNNGDGTVSVIDTADRTITTTTINVGNGPLGVAVDPTTHTAFTTNYSDGTVSVIDTARRSVTATIRAGTNPWGVAVDPTFHTVYVTNSTDGTVSVMDTATHTVTATINVGNRLWGVAVDPTTHTAYTANVDNTVSVIEPIR